MGVDSSGNPREKGYPDLPSVPQEMEVFNQNIQRYGFDEVDIMQKSNLSVNDIKKTLLGYQKRINANTDAG